MNNLFLSNLHIWKSSLENPKEKPKLEFADPLFKRRLSQITRMTIQVVHDLIEEVPQAKDFKQVFVSFRGEIEREFTINKGIIEDSEILPAGFSLSVFNTPIAAASLCLKLKAGYSVIYPSKQDFSAAFLSAASTILSGSEQNIIFVYADEYVPDVYGSLQPKDNFGTAFACILSAEKSKLGKELSIQNVKEFAKSPSEFVKQFLEK